MIDCNSIGYRRRQFAIEHGDAPVCLDHNTWFLYADGARLDADMMGGIFPPPDDPIERAKLIVLYHETKFNLARDAFDQFAQQFRPGQAGPGRTPTPADVDKKRELQKTARHWQAKLAAARKALEKAREPAWLQKLSPEERQARLEEQARQDEELNQRVAALRSEFDKIKL